MSIIIINTYEKKERVDEKSTFFIITKLLSSFELAAIVYQFICHSDNAMFLFFSYRFTLMSEYFPSKYRAKVLIISNVSYNRYL